MRSPGAILYLSSRALIYYELRWRFRKLRADESADLNLSSMQYPFLSLS